MYLLKLNNIILNNNNNNTKMLYYLKLYITEIVLFIIL